MGFCLKNWVFTNFLHVQTYKQARPQNFDRLFFVQFKGEFNPVFRGFLGTNCDKSGAKIWCWVNPVTYEVLEAVALDVLHERGPHFGRCPAC